VQSATSSGNSEAELDAWEVHECIETRIYGRNLIPTFAPDVAAFELPVVVGIPPAMAMPVDTLKA